MLDNQGLFVICPLKSLHAEGTRVPVQRPSVERLRELLNYDPMTGELRWRPRGIPTFDGAFAGRAAGSLRRSDGYVRVKVDGWHAYAHVVAWAIHHGEWPAGDVDHRDLDRANNRLINLRDATKRENEGNKPLRRDNLVRVKGVQRAGNHFRARICTPGGRVYLGLYKTVEEASAAYERAALKYFGDFARAA